MHNHNSSTALCKTQFLYCAFPSCQYPFFSSGTGDSLAFLGRAITHPNDDIPEVLHCHCLQTTIIQNQRGFVMFCPQMVYPCVAIYQVQFPMIKTFVGLRGPWRQGQTHTPPPSDISLAGLRDVRQGFRNGHLLRTTVHL